MRFLKGLVLRGLGLEVEQVSTSGFAALLHQLPITNFFFLGHWESVFTFCFISFRLLPVIGVIAPSFPGLRPRSWARLQVRAAV